MNATLRPVDIRDPNGLARRVAKILIMVCICGQCGWALATLQGLLPFDHQLQLLAQNLVRSGHSTTLARFDSKWPREQVLQSLRAHWRSDDGAIWSRWQDRDLLILQLADTAAGTAGWFSRLSLNASRSQSGSLFRKDPCGLTDALPVGWELVDRWANVDGHRAGHTLIFSAPSPLPAMRRTAQAWLAGRGARLMGAASPAPSAEAGLEPLLGHYQIDRGHLVITAHQHGSRSLLVVHCQEDA